MNLLLIGCGNIGGTLLHKWSSLGLCNRIIAVEPSKSHALDFKENHTIEFVGGLSEVPQDLNEDLTVLAIKPQTLSAVLPLLKLRPSKLIISVLTGVQIAQLSDHAPTNAKIIRLMPNIALKTGHSVNLIYTKQSLTTAEIGIIEELFTPTGKITWLNSEQHIDLLTFVSGSGPAYFLLLAQNLLEETINLGIPEDVAHTIVQQTFQSTASLVANNTNFAAMIESVTSKKGVTEAALQILRPQLQQTMQQALQAALTRLQEITSENSR